MPHNEKLQNEEDTDTDIGQFCLIQKHFLQFGFIYPSIILFFNTPCLHNGSEVHHDFMVGTVYAHKNKDTYNMYSVT